MGTGGAGVGQEFSPSTDKDPYKYHPSPSQALLCAPIQALRQVDSRRCGAIFLGW